jgi:hypothetical protein
MQKTLAVLLPLSSVVAVFAACQNKPANPPVTTPAPDAGIAMAPGDAGSADGAVAAAPAEAGAPVNPTFFTGDGGGPASPNALPAMTDAALDTAIDIAIAAMAPKVAPKMAKEGQPGRATLKEGEHFNMVVSLQPMRCYTFIGFSPPGGVAQLDLKLYAMPLNVEAGHSTPGEKAAPVMGKGSTAICPILPVAVPYKLDAVATKGAGRMGVYVYSRAK